MLDHHIGLKCESNLSKAGIHAHDGKILGQNVFLHLRRAKRVLSACASVSCQEPQILSLQANEVVSSHTSKHVSLAVSRLQSAVRRLLQVVRTMEESRLDEMLLQWAVRSLVDVRQTDSETNDSRTRGRLWHISCFCACHLRKSSGMEREVRSVNV